MMASTNLVNCIAGERTHAGLDAARKEGRIGDRPPKLKPQQRLEIVRLVKKGKKTAADAARLFGVHRPLCRDCFNAHDRP
jgi:DNA invertase Pin-like site-specific DNA recombinase